MRRPSAAQQYLNSLQIDLKSLLLKARFAGLLHGVLIIAQFTLLAWVIYQSIVIDIALQAQWFWLALLLITIVARTGAASLYQHLVVACGELAQRRARENLLRHWRSPFSARPGRQDRAETASLMVEPIDTLYGYFSRFLPQKWNALLIPGVILAVVFALDWVAGLFLLFAAPIIPAFMALVGMGAEHLNRQHIVTNQRLAGLFIDRVRNMTNIQLFSASSQAVDDISQANESCRRANMRTLKVAFLSSAVLEFFSAVAIAAVAIYIGFALLGYFTFGPAAELNLFTGLTILLLAPEYFQPLRTLSQHYHDRAAALGAADVLAAEHITPQAPGKLPAASSADHIIVDNLHFAYESMSKAVFDNFSLQLKKGRIYVIAGASGTGKSTLLRILLGLLSPKQGGVSIFGKPPGEAPVAYLPQRPFVMQASLAENLRLVAPNADDHALVQALREVNLERLIDELPHALETIIGDEGAGLSGGESHRLALARVFLAPTELVVLDEPTAALDKVNAQIVIHALQRLHARGSTVVVASHDPLLIQQADVCIRLSDGKDGRHVE